MDLDAYRFAIIGPGRLGSTLLAGLTEAGLAVSAVGVHADEDTDLSGAVPYLRVADAALQADALWLTVPDDEIFAVAGKLAAALPSRRGVPPLAIHSSGLGSVELLGPLREAGARTFCLHPLQTFSGQPRGELLQDVPCAVTAIDQQDVRLGEELARRLRMRPFRLADDEKTRYHLAAVIGCNLLVALEHEAATLMDKSTGRSDGLQVLAPLLRTTVTGLIERGPSQALTGPVARGDVGTVRAHLRLLDRESPRLATVYRALSLEALALAAPRLDDEQVRVLQGLLRPHPEGHS